MELQSPYLTAIQAIPGLTPGQKYKELYLMARSIAHGKNAHGDSAQQISIRDVPEPLIPIIRVEIAKILLQYEVVVEALKSEDCQIVDRALRIDWFFSGDNEEVISVDYFERNIFPFVSLNTRLKLIKRLAACLRCHEKMALADKFYSHLTKKYGMKQAEPMLVACDESFIWDTVVERKIVLSCRLVKNLFIRYPKLVIRYLKLSKTNGASSSRNPHIVNICDYSDFLPRLIKNHMNSLIEIIEMHDSTLGIKLSNKATERFLKSHIDVVLSRPTLYAQMMSLKVIAAKFTKAQFKCMLTKLYPPKVKDFEYLVVEKYLKYYPEQERISLVLDTYREVYKADMLDNHDVIDENFLGMLPADERARQARIKLEKEPEWRNTRWNIERMWRCYLPIEESISSIKTEISKTSMVDDRLILLQQMFFTCKVNDDKDALLETLRYFTTRHKNEQSNVIFDVLNSLMEYFDLLLVGKDHWNVLNDFIKFLYVKEELVQRITTSQKILALAIHFNLIHDLPIDDNVAMLVEINIKGYNQTWCIFEKHPEYDRTCFAKMMSVIAGKYPANHVIWKNHRLDALDGIVTSIYHFNNRNAKANNKIERLSIKDYPWLYAAVKELLETEATNQQWRIDAIKNYLRHDEPDLYEKWIPINENAISNVKTNEAREILKNEPEKILNKCNGYLEELKTSVTYYKPARRFVKTCRWYQDIPIKFAVQCLKDIAEDEIDKDALLVLGILMEGSEFARVIEPLVPKESSIDTTSDKAQATYRTIYTIPRAMNWTNPPVSLDLVMSFCQGEYLNLGLASLTNVCRRTSVDKIKKFTKELTDRRVSVKKHGIRLFCLVASINDYRDFLADLWKTEKHRSIRAIVFKKIRSLFIDDPNDETWTMMSDCMADLKNDDDDSLDDLVKFSTIHDRYVADYVKQLFQTLERLEAGGFTVTRMTQYICCVLLSIDAATSKLLPEDFSVQLVRKYFCNANVAKEINDAGMSYAMSGYLRADEDKLDERLNVFGNLYEDVLRKYWNVPHPKASTRSPINWITHKFVKDVVLQFGADNINVRIMQTILKSFLAVLKPEQDWISYALLTLGVALKDAKTSSIIAAKICETLPHLVETLSAELTIELVDPVTMWIEILVDVDHIDKAKYEVIENLCRVGTVSSCIVAAKLLFCSDDDEYDDRHNKIVEYLKKSQHPAVVALVYQHVLTMG